MERRINFIGRKALDRIVLVPQGDAFAAGQVGRYPFLTANVSKIYITKKQVAQNGNSILKKYQTNMRNVSITFSLMVFESRAILFCHKKHRWMLIHAGQTISSDL